MADIVVYHNPACSKSRGALAILEERGDAAEIVEYLKTNPSQADLERIVDAVTSEPGSDEPAALVRKDKRFGKLGLDAGNYVTKEQVVALLLEHPELMERPVVFVGDKAVIARPSERVLELLQ